MQDCTVMAFRKRLLKRGYTSVSIRREKSDGIYSGNYIVSAIEPLGKNFVSTVYSIVAMRCSFRF